MLYHIEFIGGRGRLRVGAKDYTPELTKVKRRWKMPLKISWTVPVKIRRKSDNPFENATDT